MCNRPTPRHAKLTRHYSTKTAVSFHTLTDAIMDGSKTSTWSGDLVALVIRLWNRQGIQTCSLDAAFDEILNWNIGL